MRKLRDCFSALLGGLVLYLLGPAVGVVAPAAAHDFRVTDTQLEIVAPDTAGEASEAASEAASGRFALEMIVDLDALALGVAPDADSEQLFERLRQMAPAEREQRVERLRRYMVRRMRVVLDGEFTEFVVDFPDVGRDRGDPPSWLGTRVLLEGEIPAGSQQFAIRASRSFPPLNLTVKAADRTLFQGLLERGATSPAIDLLNLPTAAPIGSRFWSYIKIGFDHILPAGIDHILFVLGLVLARPKSRSLLLQVSTFTVAHSLTLACASLGWVSLPARAVEVAIALSIVYIGVENLTPLRNRRYRLAVVFFFGLLHGLGFAGALSELLPTTGGQIAALLGFNVGVELGQLVVIAVAVAVLWQCGKRASLERALCKGGSLAIAAAGGYWVVERLVNS